MSVRYYNDAWHGVCDLCGSQGVIISLSDEWLCPSDYQTKLDEQPITITAPRDFDDERKYGKETNGNY